MKIRIEVDCTPEEARRFLGLPDVTPLHEALVAEMREKIVGSLGALDAEALTKAWLVPGLAGLEEFQKALWSQMTGASGSGSRRRGARAREPE